MRIVSLLSSATEILCQLGLTDALVAISHECDYPPAVQGKPRATFSNIAVNRSSGEIDAQVKALLAAGAPLYGIDVELLVELQPDLIVTQAQCDVCAVRYQDVLDTVANSRALRGTTVMALGPHSLAEVLADIRTLGDATQRQSQAEALIESLQARVVAVKQQTAGLTPNERPRTACLEWIEPPMLSANWTPQLLEWAGGQCELTLPSAHSGYTTWSELVEFDPQVLVVMPCGFDLRRSVLEAQPLADLPHWSGLSAVRNKRVYVVDGNAYFNRSGPRLVDSLELLAHLLHPDRCVAPVATPEYVAWQRGL